jgi:MATE family multidrug resistance protein
MAEPRNILRPHSEGSHGAAPSPLLPESEIPTEDRQWGDRQDEYTPLLSARSSDGSEGQWDDAVLKGLIDTTWKRETKLLARSTAPLALTFALQYSLTVASIFTVGHIGKVELGAVSLAHSTYESRLSFPLTRQ